MRQSFGQPTVYLLLAAIALAAALRLWELDTMPPGLYHDEAYNGLDALALLEGETFPRFHEGWELYAADAHAERAAAPTRWPVFFEGNYGREPLHVYLMAVAIAVFGATPFALRFVPAVAGILAVLTTYLAANAVLPRRWLPEAPLAAAFALALFFPAVHFSRFGVRAMVFLPIATACVYAFWRGAAVAEGRSKSGYRWFASAGLLLGLSVYTYASARLFVLLFVVFIPFWLGRDRARWQRLLPGVGLMAVISAIVAAPVLLFFVRYPYYFAFRIGYVAEHGAGVVAGKPWLTWLYNAGRVVRGLFWYGETHLRHNLPGRPFLDPIQGGLALLGTGAAVWTVRLRSDRDTALRWLFIGLWLLVMLLPSILSGDAPHFGRLSGAAAPLAILVGAGVATLARWLRRRVSATLVTLAMVGLLAASALLTVRDYFGRYATHPALPLDFYDEEWLLGEYLASQPAGADLYLSPTQAEMATLYFAVGGAEVLRSFSSPEGALPLGRPGRHALYLLRQPTQEAIATLRERRPDAVVEDEVAGGVIPVRAPVLEEAGQPEATWAGAIALSGWDSAREDDDLVITLRWQALTSVTRDYTVFVHLLDADDNIVAQEDRQPAGYPTSDWQVNEWIEDRFRVALPAELPAGFYRVRTGFYPPGTNELLGAPVILGTPVTLP